MLSKYYVAELHILEIKSQKPKKTIKYQFFLLFYSPAVFMYIYPNFDKFHDIPHYTVNSIFITWIP